MNAQRGSQVVSLMVQVLLIWPAWTEKACADFVFGSPTNLGPTVNSLSDELGADTSPDGLQLYFSSDRPGGYGDWDLYVATREATGDDWGIATNLGEEINSQYGEWEPSISTDGLSLYFSDVYPAYGSWRPDGLGHGDIWVSTRSTPDDLWGAPENLGPIINGLQAYWPDISADGLSLYMISHSGHRGGSGLCDVFVARRETTFEPFAEPSNLGTNVNSSAGELSPSISADELTLLFYRGVTGTGDLWIATRKNTSDLFEPAVKLPEPVNSAHIDASPHLSTDGSILYFCSDRPGGFGGYDLWQVSITPVVDFNSDGEVNGKDLLVMAEHWGGDCPLCDIGPTPLGDGIVDVQDLAVLVEHMEPIDRTLVAHWALDETKGSVARDSAGGDHNGTIIGTPAWQPTGGVVNGALQFNGATFVVADFVLNPQEGPFSVFAWVKSGAPGQVLISQQTGYDWLVLDPATGALMTELRSGGRQSKALYSDVDIADGNWHRVGFTWDGSNRRLYVDDILVAEDTDVALGACDGGLNIGCGKLMAPNTFFTGLVDDIRIYNRAVRP